MSDVEAYAASRGEPTAEPAISGAIEVAPDTLERRLRRSLGADVGPDVKFKGDTVGKSAGRSFAAGVTESVPGISWGVGLANIPKGEKDPLAAWRRERDVALRQIKEQRAESPAGMLGLLAGGAAMAPVAAGAGVVAQGARGAAKLAGIGSGLYGAGASESKTLGGTLADAAKAGLAGAATAGIAGKAIQGGGKLFGKAADVLRSKAGQRIEGRAIESFTGGKVVGAAEEAAIKSTVKELGTTEARKTGDVVSELLRDVPAKVQDKSLKSLGGRAGVAKFLKQEDLLPSARNADKLLEASAPRLQEAGEKIGNIFTLADRADKTGRELFKVNKALDSVKRKWRADPRAVSAIEKEKEFLTTLAKPDKKGLLHLSAVDEHAIQTRLGAGGFENVSDKSFAAKLGRDVWGAVKDDLQEHVSEIAAKTKSVRGRELLNELPSLNKRYSKLKSLTDLAAAKSKKLQREPGAFARNVEELAGAVGALKQTVGGAVTGNAAAVATGGLRLLGSAGRGIRRGAADVLDKAALGIGGARARTAAKLGSEAAAHEGRTAATQFAIGDQGVPTIPTGAGRAVAALDMADVEEYARRAGL